MHIKNKRQYFAVLTFDDYVKFILLPLYFLLFQLRRENILSMGNGCYTAMLWLFQLFLSV